MVHGGAGSDWIDGGTGVDRLYGDEGDDTLQAGSATAEDGTVGR